MARIAKSEFGNRHHRPAPVSQLDDATGWRRQLDWRLLVIVAIVFVACFIWLF